MMKMVKRFSSNYDDSVTAKNWKELKTTKEVEEEKEIESGKEGKLGKGIEDFHKVCL